MNISKYTAFFHDGSIINIQHFEDEIVFSMASAEMDEEDIGEDIILSKDDSIHGKLHIKRIRNIKVNKELFLGDIQMNYDYGKIFDLEIKQNSVELSIDWVNFPPKPQVNEFSVIHIEAEKVWWENIPNLEDQLDLP